MKRTSDHIREHLLESLGVLPRRQVADLPQLSETEWCEMFEQARRYRLAMGCFRYGPLSRLKIRRHDFMAGLRAKLAAYDQTGNTEALVDAANYLMLEFMWPSHSQAHFRGEDDVSHCPVKGSK